MRNKWEILNVNWSGIIRQHKHETFVKIEGTRNFFVSTLGRVAKCKRNGKYCILPLSDRYEIGFCGERKYRTIFAKELVADAFLVKVPGRNCIWHKDHNHYNDKYTNLIYVTKEDYIKLLQKKVKVNQLDYVQYYYPIWAFNKRVQMQKYTDMLRRCQEKNYGTVCDEWLSDFDKFAKWLENASYPHTGCMLEIDKDILFPGNREYSPQKCCLIDKSINLRYSLYQQFHSLRPFLSCWQQSAFSLVWTFALHA